MTLVGRLRRRDDDERGVALVEFALILPVFVLLVFGVLDFGRAINYWLDANHLANEGARWVVVNRDLGEPLPSFLRDQADTAELRTGGTDSVPSALQVAVCYPDGATSGNRVVVKATVVYNWLPVLGLDSVSSTLTGSATMRLENTPTNHPAVGSC
jgi:Flp pilus assembly protein TadG